MKVIQPGSHLDHMIRQTRAHHTQLSAMADTKANMLLTMSSILVTISLPFLAKPELRIVSYILVPFCILAILLAAYSTMPRLHLSKADEVEPSSNTFNPLFFGHFNRLSYEDYSNIMESVLNDPSRCYEIQLREIYTLGQFLEKRKYLFLRLAYIAFLLGIVLSVGVFAALSI